VEITTNLHASLVRPAPRFKDALEVLARHSVDFIVVGGVAAVLTGRILRPDADLAGPGHHLLLTTCGPVDVLGTIGQGDGYDELLSDVVARQIGDHRVRTLGLATLIRTKEAAGRAKDLAVLAILRRTLEESTK